VDWLVVNEQEAAAVLGRPVTGPEGAPAAALALAGMAGGHAVITLGAAGAVLARPPGAAGAPDTPAAVTVPGFSVASVDSVGAGDAFVAALAVALAAGVEPAAAVRAACAVGAAATTRQGAQDALPRPADVLAATGMPWPVPGP
jgi:ribokinase